MLKPVKMQFLQFCIHITALQITNCDLTEIMFFVVHHRDHLFDWSCHVYVKLFENFQAKLRIL